MKTALLLLFTLLSTAFADKVRRDQELGCPDGEEQAVFSIILDSASASENGWYLNCDEVSAHQSIAEAAEQIRSTLIEGGGVSGTTSVWNVDPGTLVGGAGTFVTDTACIPTTATCTFSIVDSAGNGLEVDMGWYFLTMGATTIASSTEEDSPVFTKRYYCFGPGCEEPPLETSMYFDDQYTYDAIYDNDDGCAEGEEEAVLTVVLDENAQETGWTMVCDDELIWNAPARSLSDPEGTFVTQTACLPDSVLFCDFRIVDTGGDGLTGDYGWYSLRFGATDIAISSQEDTQAFVSRRYCFGVDCDMLPVEAENDDFYFTDDAYYYSEEPEACTAEESKVTFSIVLDQNAKETGWTLVCDDEIVWNAPPRSLSNPEDSTITQETCVSPSAYCELSIVDTAGDGLGVGNGGWYQLQVDGITVATSTEEESTEFFERHYCFGPGCGEPQDEDEVHGNRGPIIIDTEVDFGDSGDQPASGQTSTGSSGNDEANLGIILGSVFGGLFLLSLVGCFFCRRSQAKVEQHQAVQTQEK